MSDVHVTSAFSWGTCPTVNYIFVQYYKLRNQELKKVVELHFSGQLKLQISFLLSDNTANFKLSYVFLEVRWSLTASVNFEYAN